SFQPLAMRMPVLLPGRGTAIRGDACELVRSLGEFDLAYLDPPYNQHRYDSNYHIWETLLEWDSPEHYGVACKRTDLRGEGRSVFNSRSSMPAALEQVVRDVEARIVVLSYNDESFCDLDQLKEMCSSRGHVELLAFESDRYVGARIGIHNPSGKKVGTVGRLRNLEYLLVCGDRADVRKLVAPWRARTRSTRTVGAGPRPPTRTVQSKGATEPTCVRAASL
ncbi:MAG: DNA adenine methylase, partial [Acidimicrobiales bacterium]